MESDTPWFGGRVEAYGQLWFDLLSGSRRPTHALDDPVSLTTLLVEYVWRFCMITKSGGF